MAGQLYQQGLTNMGQSLGQGIADYMQLSRQQAVASQSVAQLLADAEKNGTGFDKNTQALVDKWKNGKASANDTMALAGGLQTARQLQNQDIQTKAAQQQLVAAQQQQQLQSLQLSAAARQNSAMQNLMTMGQANAGVGGGVLSPDTLARYAAMQGTASATPDTQQNINRLMASWAYATGSPPPASLITNYMDRAKDIGSPVGIVPLSPSVDDKTGTVTKKNFQWLYQYANGNMVVKPEVASVGPNDGFPAPTFLYNSRGGWQQTAAGPGPAATQPNLTAAAQARINAIAGERTNAQQLQHIAQNMQTPAFAYILANQGTGDWSNSKMGGETGLAFRNTIVGGAQHGLGEQLNSTAGQFAGSFMQGKTGIRNQKEFDAVTAMAPHSTEANTAIYNKVMAAPLVAQWNMKRLDSEEAYLRAGMSPADAASKAASDTPVPSWDMSQKIPESFWKQEATREEMAAKAKKEPQQKNAAAPMGQYITGKVYKDSQGNRAIWTGSGWAPAP